MPEKQTIVTENDRYLMSFERSATKGTIGYKVVAKGDTLADVSKDAEILKREAESMAGKAE